MPFFAAQLAIGAVICGSVKPARTMNGERCGMTDVAAAITIIGTLASVATGAAASASGVRPKPARTSTLLLARPAPARGAWSSPARSPVSSLTISSTLRPATVSPFLLHVEPARGLDLAAGRRERSGQRQDEADLERVGGEGEAGASGRGDAAASPVRKRRRPEITLSRMRPSCDSIVTQLCWPINSRRPDRAPNVASRAADSHNHRQKSEILSR